MGDAILGGVLIGLAAVWLRFSTGRIAGISGILGQALKARGGLAGLFLLGLGVGGWIVHGFRPPAAVPAVDLSSSAVLFLGGLLVGVGTRLGSGCTSGHGVCGIARLSPRSVAATITFMLLGMLTATLLGALK